MLHRIKYWILGFCVQYIAPIIGAMYPKTNFPYTIQDLLQFPANSLGLQTALKLQQQQFTLIPQFETHDFKHVLLNYDMNGLGECRMVFFLYGNGNKTFVMRMALLLSVLLYPNYFATFKQDYRRGKRYVNLSHINLTFLLGLPIQEVRQQLHKSNTIG